MSQTHPNIVEDRWGNKWTASTSDAVTSFEQTVLSYLGMRSDTGDHLKAALKTDPEMPMAHILKGYFGKFFETAALDGMVGKALQTARDLVDGAVGGTQQERAHLAALERWVARDNLSAIEIWEAILLDHPRDVMAAKLVQYAQFYRGDGGAMRKSLARILHAWTEDVPGYGFMLGSYGFAMEEAGDYRGAEAAARRAIEINPEDIWSSHACAHVLEMEGRAREGAALLDELSRHWAPIHNFRHHAEWHRALFLLELRDYDAVLEQYDAAVWTPIAGDYLDISNGVSLLWRLQDEGVDVGDRWAPLAELAASKLSEQCLVFADLHYLISLVKTSNDNAANALFDAMTAYAEGDQTAHHAQSTVLRHVGLDMADCIIALERGASVEATASYWAVRDRLDQIGGSHAQRDLFDRIGLRAVLTGGDWTKARSILSERIAMLPKMAWNWRLLAELETALGNDTAAQRAISHADELIAP